MDCRSSGANEHCSRPQHGSLFMYVLPTKGVVEVIECKRKKRNESNSYEKITCVAKISKQQQMSCMIYFDMHMRNPSIAHNSSIAHNPSSTRTRHARNPSIVLALRTRKSTNTHNQLIALALDKACKQPINRNAMPSHPGLSKQRCKRALQTATCLSYVVAANTGCLLAIEWK